MTGAQHLAPGTARLASARRAFSRRGGWRRWRPRRQAPIGSGATWPRLAPIYGWLFVLFTLGVVAYYTRVNPYGKSQAILVLAAAVLLIACVPMTRFLLLARVHQLPIFEAHCLFYGLCFGFAGFVRGGNGKLAATEGQIERALMATLVGLALMQTTYFWAGPVVLRRIKPICFLSGIPARGLERIAWSVCAFSLAGSVVGRVLNTSAFAQVVQPMMFFGFFLLFILAYERRISGASRLVVYLGLLPYMVLFRTALTTGFLAGLVMLLFWICLVLLRVNKRVPLLVVGLAVAAYLGLNPAKFYVRQVLRDQGRELTPSQLFLSYRDGLREFYGKENLAVRRREGLEVSFDRINLLQVLAAVMRDTPDPVPFMYGATYLPLFVKWIPRVVWSGKPEERTGNNWAQRYGYLDADDRTTSFDLPWLPEMFANFGWPGMVVGMCFVGLLYQALWKSVLASPDTPAQCALGIAAGGSLVVTESNLSLQVGGLVISGVFLLLARAGLDLLGVSLGNPGRFSARGKSRKRGRLQAQGSP